MPTASLWERTLTFFPQFRRSLTEECRPDATVAVVGAGDGKFVLPLAEAGYSIIAIESDASALNGGEVLLPTSGIAYAPGLVERMKGADLDHLVRIRCADFLEVDPIEMAADAVWTSCSWHYSANHKRPLGEFVTRMQRLVHPGGLFGAEFMMPVEERHQHIEHYTTPDKLARYFTAADWTVLLTLQTEAFVERAHVGQLHDHTHRMGLLLAKRHQVDHEEVGTRQR
ncbi:bifunctional 2-polyprenyl-6-hydroxyphenol methylase/3-demethylubiquinol 3-O-methyltransferase UbiG [Nocardia sp. CNY236]|uniref:class I SAM-dependent methyltransferase n=1 Tax=Nocardia sp. CNY236 TaxID=1169152 RepID=UPI0003F857F9|nr:class I SAM-dependent methyltransferase [Nocardia sp. CNY236]